MRNGVMLYHDGWMVGLGWVHVNMNTSMSIDMVGMMEGFAGWHEMALLRYFLR